MRKIFILLGLVVLLFGCTAGLSKTNKTKNDSIVTPANVRVNLENLSTCVQLPNGVNRSGIIELNECKEGNLLLTHICEEGVLVDVEFICPVGKFCSGGTCITAQINRSNQSSTIDICRDSDGGNLPERAGEVNVGSGRYPDTCLGIYDLTEYFCVNENVSSKTVNCGNGYRCYQGACVLQERTCVDSNVQDQSISGVTTQYGGGRVLRTYSDICLGKENKKSYSCENDSVKETDMKCPSGSFCNLGACVGVCLETDTGQNYGWKGSVQLGNTNNTDYCLSDNRSLNEFYCTDNDTIESIITDCPIGCYEGRCLNSNEVSCTTEGSNNGNAAVYRGTELLFRKAAACKDYKVITTYVCDSNVISEKTGRCNNNEICMDNTCQRIQGRGCYDLHLYNISQAIITNENSIIQTQSDRCVSDQVVSIFSCQEGRAFAQEVRCPIGQRCINGACSIN